MEYTYALKAKISDEKFDDFNLFEVLFERTIKVLDMNLDRKDKQQILGAIS